MHPPLVPLAGRLAPAEPDQNLLARFVRDRDEAAFAALVYRHGPTVYGVCRRVLGNPADAEDAFQAVFLVLVNRADALVHRPALGGWLYEVAVRVARKARTALARVRKHERLAALARGEPAADPPPADPPAWLDRELAALPERFREPVVRCLVQGRPRAEVAAELGIPEGTLASRLDTARKRLAGRLARHRVPLAFGGLLAPVPTALAAATVTRAADGAGAVIHQLANEVSRAMAPNTTWPVAAAVGVLAAVGGLLLAAGGEDPPAKPPERPGQVKAPPEPAWKAAFDRTYRLASGQYVKRVPPPYIPERVEFLLHRRFAGKQVEPAVVERERAYETEVGPFLTIFLEQDGDTLSKRFIISSTFLMIQPEKRQGDNLLPVVNAVSSVTGLSAPEFVVDPKSKGDPLFAEGNKTVHGDFVTRRDAPLEKLVPQLETILREECMLDVRLTVRKEEQPVFVVGGTFKPNPPAWRPKKELDVYATEDGLNKEYDHFDPEKHRKAGKYEAVRSMHYTGTPVGFVRFVGYRLRTRMVWDAPLPTEPRVTWIDHTVRYPAGFPAVLEDASDRDPDKVLKVVAEQTGLTFKKERRKVAVLYLGLPERK